MASTLSGLIHATSIAAAAHAATAAAATYVATVPTTQRFQRASERISTTVDAVSHVPKKAVDIFNIVHPRFGQLPRIPADAEKIVIGNHGFFCTKGGVEDFKPHFDQRIVYIDSGDWYDHGFTRANGRYLCDFVDAVAQRHGKPVVLHGQSGGGFHAIRVLMHDPSLVEGLVFTVVPHKVQLRWKDVRTNTSIGPVLLPMIIPGVRSAYDVKMIKGYGEFIRGKNTEFAQHLRRALEDVYILAYGAAADRVVNPHKCGVGNSDTRRTLYIADGHSDTARCAGPSMRFLLEHGIGAVIPDELSSDLVDEDHVPDFVPQKTRVIIGEFFESARTHHPAGANTPLAQDRDLDALALPALAITG